MTAGNKSNPHPYFPRGNFQKQIPTNPGPPRAKNAVQYHKIPHIAPLCPRVGGVGVSIDKWQCITGRIISYYANNGHIHISQRYIYFTDRHTLYKTVDILLHVTAGKLVNYVQTTIHTAFNNCMGCYRNIFTLY
jgi:hypothetical protein